MELVDARMAGHWLDAQAGIGRAPFLQRDDKARDRFEEGRLIVLREFLEFLTEAPLPFISGHAQALSAIIASSAARNSSPVMGPSSGTPAAISRSTALSPACHSSVQNHS